MLIQNKMVNSNYFKTTQWPHFLKSFQILLLTSETKKNASEFYQLSRRKFEIKNTSVNQVNQSNSVKLEKFYDSILSKMHQFVVIYLIIVLAHRPAEGKCTPEKHYKIVMPNWHIKL